MIYIHLCGFGVQECHTVEKEIHEALKDSHYKDVYFTVINQYQIVSVSPYTTELKSSPYLLIEAANAHAIESIVKLLAKYNIMYYVQQVVLHRVFSPKEVRAFR